MGTDRGAGAEDQPAERLERLVAESPGSVVSAPEQAQTSRRVLGAVGLLAGIGVVVAVGLIAVWNFVLSHVVRAAMSHWAG